jgi:hypothetical protein
MELIPPTELPDWLKGSAEEAEEADWSICVWWRLFIFENSKLFLILNMKIVFYNF